MDRKKPQYFEIKNKDGEITGPHSIEEIKEKIGNKALSGDELGRAVGSSQWLKVSSLPEVNRAILEALKKILTPSKGAGETDATVILAQDEPSIRDTVDEDEYEGLEPTQAVRKKTALSDEGLEKTRIGPVRGALQPDISSENLELRSEETKVFVTDGRPKTARSWITIMVFGILMGVASYYLLLEPPKKNSDNRAVRRPIRAVMPSFLDTPANPSKSKEAVQVGIKAYLLDNVTGYRLAAASFLSAVELDKKNPQALALLASSYINLFESSNKDENYFSAIRKLIELSRAKGVELPESVIADVEFYLMVGQTESAENRIVEYTKGKAHFPDDLYYYLSLVYFEMGNKQNAQRFIGFYNAQNMSLLGPRVRYLKAKIAEATANVKEAEDLYKENLKLFPSHITSGLKLANLIRKQGRWREGENLFSYLVKKVDLLSPEEGAFAYYLRGQSYVAQDKIKEAVSDFSAATRLDPKNDQILLDLFSARAKLGELSPDLKRHAQMYFYLAEGEQKIQQGKLKEALYSFLNAQYADPSSPIPLEKVGDVFNRMHNLENAKINYKKAIQLSPKKIDLWSKYIQVLIDAYEWDAVGSAVKALNLLPPESSASLIRRLRGDVFAKKGDHRLAIENYRRAMSYDRIDPAVYLSYAKSLVEVKDFEQARFFFSSVLQFDPLNMDAIAGIAKSIAGTKSIEHAIEYLEGQFNRFGRRHAEIITMLSEYEIDQGSIEKAKAHLIQAQSLSSDYARPWLVMGDLEAVAASRGEKGAAARALTAYKYYSDRNSSDPVGYVKRFEVFLNDSKFDLARKELDKVYQSYQRYPGLHYMYGRLNSATGNSDQAVEEYKAEVKNHPNNINAYLYLGIELIKIGDAKEALRYLSDAERYSGGQWADAKFWSGEANYLLENYDGAVALLSLATQLDPGNPKYYKSLGRAYIKAGNILEGKKAFQKYLQLAPDALDREEIGKYIR